MFTYLLTYVFYKKNIAVSSECPLLKSTQVMYKLPQNIKQIATIGGGVESTPS